MTIESPNNLEGVADERVQNEYIIDTDFHLELTENALIDYIKDKRVQNKVKRFGMISKPSGGVGTSVAFATHEKDWTRFHGKAITGKQIRKVLDDFGIDVVVATPTNYLPFHLTNYPKVSTELARAYNDYIVDQVVNPNEGIYASLVIPHWEPQKAANEIDRIGSKSGIVGGHSFQIPKPWGRPELDPIFDALTDQSLPLSLHVGSLNAGALVNHEANTFLESLVVGANNNLVANVVSMIVNGVFDKYDQLKVIFQEGGTQWIAYLANRLDDLYQAYSKDLCFSPRIFEAEKKYLDRMPSEYIYDNMYVTTQPIALPSRSDEAKGILTACHADETFMFSSDWPHNTTDAANWLFTQAGIDEELRTQISHKNAEDIFNI